MKSPFMVLSGFLFILSNVVVEGLRLSRDNPLREPMSAYLKGPYSEFQVEGYALLALGLIAFGEAIKRVSMTTQRILWVTAVSLVGVVVTKLLHHGVVIEHVHTTFAGLAFLSLTVAEIVYGCKADTWNVLFPIVALVIFLVIAIMTPTYTGPIFEKFYALILVLGIMAYSLERDYE